MSRSPVVIGVDSSTQSTKAAFTDATTGRLLAVGRAPHRVTGEGGARETDPEVWWNALREAVAAGLKESGVDASSVTGIAVAGQQHGLVVLDRTGRSLRPALLWNDTRSAPQATVLTETLGGPEAWTARTGTVPVASMTATKWQWLRENDPATAEATAAIRLPHDFLTERLAGTAATDPGDASGTCWYSTATGEYDPELLALLGLDADLLPAVATTGATRVGSLTAGAAAELGLPAGIAVAAGTGDNMSAAVGLGFGGSRPAGPPGAQPRDIGDRVRRHPHPPRHPRARGIRRGGRYVPATGVHPQLHTRRGQGGRAAAAGPGGRGARRRSRPAAVSRRRAHPRSARRVRPADRASPRHHTAATAGRRLRGRGRDGAARAGRGAARLRPRPRRPGGHEPPAAAGRRRRAGPDVGRYGTTALRPSS